jgi:hypothetical protein
LEQGYGFFEFFNFHPGDFLYSPFLPLYKNFRTRFSKFFSSNSENTFRNFFPRQKKFGKHILKYLFKGKNENSGVEKKHEGWKERHPKFLAMFVLGRPNIVWVEDTPCIDFYFCHPTSFLERPITKIFMSDT